MPSGSCARIDPASAVAGTTVTRQPAETSERRMFRFAP